MRQMITPEYAYSAAGALRLLAAAVPAPVAASITPFGGGTGVTAAKPAGCR